MGRFAGVLKYPDPPRLERIPYADLRPIMRSGDLVLWHGNGIASKFIMWGTRSWASHVSVVYRTDEVVSGIVLNFESTTQSKTPDWFTRGRRSGSQVNALSHRVATYDGRMFYRRLIGPLSCEQQARLSEIRRETSGIQYEQNWLEWLGAALWVIRNREDRSSLFCSELVAYVLHELCILHRTRPSNEYAPRAFTGSMATLNGYLYDVPIEIDPSDLIVREREVA